MDIRYISEFVTLVETGKFSEAADRLYISQSSISKHIKALEMELGVPLLERQTKRKVILSEYGQLFLPYAEQISLLQKEYMSIQKKHQRENTEILYIGSIPAMQQYDITGLLSGFQASCPDIVLRVEEMDSTLAKAKVSDGDLDFAFVRDISPKKNDMLKRVPYTSDRVCAILPGSHKLAKERSISLLQLADEKFLLLKDASFMYDVCMAECEKAGFEPAVVYTGSRAYNILGMVAQGNGVALLTRRPISRFKDDFDVALVDIEPAIETKINLIYHEKTSLTKSAKQFLEYFQQEMA
ncbi:MAG: LysR family transcriptional regulator [Oscillospiraceae bacterium]|nr:LysR family transcriptional regulator [Oscillospiraceae bacterium]